MRRPARPILAIGLSAVVALAACGENSTGPAVNERTPTTSLGENGLFIGHSFFVPVSRAFDAIALASGIDEHDHAEVFAGGASGGPDALWENESRRAAIEAQLATGEVELFGLTAESQAESVTSYRRWIDMALGYNPDTRIFIGMPWQRGGPAMDTEEFDAVNETLGDQLFQIVDALRAAYPGVRIDYANYGIVASRMKAAFEAKQLEDIAALQPGAGVDERAVLFRDDLGHGGPMMIDAMALVWMHTLYGQSLNDLALPEWDEADLRAVTSEVIEFNRQYEGS